MLRPLFAIIPVVLFLGLATGHSVRTGVLLDEAGYTALRVADNFRHGHGPVFNPGERRDLVDSPAWFALLSVVGVSSYATQLVQLLGLCLGVGVLLVVLAGPRLPVAGTCASLFLGLDGLFAARATSGTSAMLAALYVVGLYVVLRRLRGRGDDADPRVLAGWSACAALVRWELVAVSLPATLGWAVTDARRWRAWVPFAAAVAGAGFWLGLRGRYFDGVPAAWEPWPPTAAGVGEGMLALADLVVRRPLLGLGGLVLLASWVRGRFRLGRGCGLAWGMAALAGFGVFPCAGHDVERHVLVLLPLAYLMAVDAVWRGTRTRLGLVAALLLVIAQPAATWSARSRQPESRLALVRLGQWLRTHALSGTVVGAREVGALGFFSGLPMEDVVGQVSPRVAAARRAEWPVRYAVAASDFGTMLRQEPDLVIAGPADPVPSAIVYVPNMDAVPPAIRGSYGIYRWAGNPVWNGATPSHPSR